MKYTARVLQCNVPTPHTGKIYPTDEVKKAIGVFMTSVARMGEMDHDSGHEVNLERVSHVITNTYVDSDGWWVAELETLDTPMGNILEKLLEAGIQPGINPRSIGYLNEHSNWRVKDLQIIALDVTGQTPAPSKELDPTLLATLDGLRSK